MRDITIALLFIGVLALAYENNELNKQMHDYYEQDIKRDIQQQEQILKMAENSNEIGRQHGELIKIVKQHIQQSNLTQNK